jgi:O-succinylbenzoate synthase
MRPVANTECAVSNCHMRTERERESERERECVCVCVCERERERERERSSPLPLYQHLQTWDAASISQTPTTSTCTWQQGSPPHSQQQPNVVFECGLVRGVI